MALVKFVRPAALVRWTLSVLLLLCGPVL